MRLAQLARKLAIKPSDVTTFLASQNIVLEDSSNAKVADEYVALVIHHFAPEMLAGSTDMETPSAEVEEIVDTINEEAATTVIATPAEVVEREPVTESETKEDILPEVIKPQKVELPGLKVVGKIDLPEPKKKVVEEKPAEEATAAEGTTAVEKPAEGRPARNNRRPSRQEQKPRKNPIALQREREEREALRKKIEEKKKEKELKTQRYLRKVTQHTPPTKRAKRKDEEQYEVLVDEKQKPKGLFGKIVSWFVSE